LKKIEEKEINSEGNYYTSLNAAHHRRDSTLFSRMPIIRGADFLPMHLEYVAPSSLEMIVVLRIALAIFGVSFLPESSENRYLPTDSHVGH